MTLGPDPGTGFGMARSQARRCDHLYTQYSSCILSIIAWCAEEDNVSDTSSRPARADRPASDKAAQRSRYRWLVHLMLLSSVAAALITLNFWRRRKRLRRSVIR